MKKSCWLFNILVKLNHFLKHHSNIGKFIGKAYIGLYLALGIVLLIFCISVSSKYIIFGGNQVERDVCLSTELGVGIMIIAFYLVEFVTWLGDWCHRQYQYAKLYLKHQNN